MSVPRQSRRDFPRYVQYADSRLADAVRESSRLTPRDHHVLALLSRHRAMRADHLARLAFPNIHRARHRLLLLTDRGVLARARRRDTWNGRRPWIYTLGPVGQMIHAVRADARMPKPAETIERVFRVLQSPTLEHDLGVIDVLARLVDHSRHHPGAQLDHWQTAAAVAEECGGIVRPDAGATWTEQTEQGPPPARVVFFLEYDADTEPHRVLLRKIDAYAELADTGLTRPVLFVFSGPAREQHFHDHLTHRYRGAPPVPIATTDHGRTWANPDPDRDATAHPHRHRGAYAAPYGPWGPDGAPDTFPAVGDGSGPHGVLSPAQSVWWRPGDPARRALAQVTGP
ncbi:replication-relaxation family protein [Pseudonocardia sp. CA-107938]|uniref:replication-relaxation family protein n=1 Tax=Pseudonocardia sp. CA-107938 TaxID=3240021 RepID=UPI003D8B3CF7